MDGRHQGLTISAELRSGLRFERSCRITAMIHDVFLDETRHSHVTSPKPGVQMGTEELSEKPDEMLGGGEEGRGFVV